MSTGLHHTVLCNRNSQCSFVVCHLDQTPWGSSVTSGRTSQKMSEVGGGPQCDLMWFRCRCFKMCVITIGSMGLVYLPTFTIDFSQM